MRNPVNLFKGYCQICWKRRPCALVHSIVGHVQRRVDITITAHVCLNCWKTNKKHFVPDPRHK